MQPQAFYRAVADDFSAVDGIIKKQLTSRVPLVSKIGDYITSAGGKRLRPLLVLLCGKALGREGDDLRLLAATIVLLSLGLRAQLAPQARSGAPVVLFALGAAALAGVAVGAGLGWMIDKLAGTSPWGLVVFLLLGFVAGVLNVLRSVGKVAEFGHGKNRGPDDRRN